MSLFQDDWSVPQLIAYTLTFFLALSGLLFLMSGSYVGGAIVLSIGIVLGVFWAWVGFGTYTEADPTSRRAALSTIGGIVVGGAVFAVSGYSMGKEDGVEEGERNARREAWEDWAQPNRLNSPQTENAEISLDLDVGEHRSVELSPTNDAYITVVMLSMSDIDVLLLDDEDYQNYKNDADDIDYRMMGSSLGTREAVNSFHLSEGTYHVVFDNTTLGHAKPAPDVQVEGSVTMWEKESYRERFL